MKQAAAAVASWWVWASVTLAAIYVVLHAGMLYSSLRLLAGLCRTLMGQVK